jgi:hypothetical protein
MDRSAFQYLYMHANSLAELGFERAAEGMLAELENQPDPLAHLSEEQRQELATEQMREFQRKFEAGEPNDLDDFYRDFASRHPDPLDGALEAQAPAASDPFGPSEASGDGEPAERDLGVYLDKVYAADAVLAERIDAAMAQLDMAQLDAALAALPPQLPPLTAPLDPAGLEQWLALYQANDAALNDIVTTIRFAELG